METPSTWQRKSFLQMETLLSVFFHNSGGRSSVMLQCGRSDLQETKQTPRSDIKVHFIR